MRLKFLGAAREVTGSMHLLEPSAGSILIDCGFFQGRREESRRRNGTGPRETRSADAAILTHAHIDHSGSLPTLVKSGFEGAIYTIPATRDLCAYMLRDSARIQQADAEHLNRKFADDPGFEPIQPPYDEARLGHDFAVRQRSDPRTCGTAILRGTGDAKEPQLAVPTSDFFAVRNSSSATATVRVRHL